jgi:ferredoxin-NADP reductase
MTGTILLIVFGIIVVNQLFASFVHRTLRRSWPCLAITLGTQSATNPSVQNRAGGRRASDKRHRAKDKPAQREVLLKRALEVVVASPDQIANKLVAHDPFAMVSPTRSDQQQAGRAGDVAVSTWTGWRKVRVDHCRDESPDCRSFRLVPVDGKPFPRFRAGQSILVSVFHPETGKRISRFYSLSGGPAETYYRITVKRVPGGTLSNLLHDCVGVNDELEVQAPRGAFCVDDHLRDQPLVLIAAGIGITPMLSMFLENLENTPDRRVEIFYELRTPENAPFLNLLRLSIKKVAGSLPTRLHVFFSKPTGCDIHGDDTCGRLSAATILERCRTTRGQYMICGPHDFMSSIAAGLVAGGVAEDRVHYESFGGKSIGPGALAVHPDSQSDTMDLSSEQTFEVDFSASGRQADWSVAAGSVLDLGESIGLELHSSCRSGDCGACVMKLRRGSVAYASPPTCDFAADEIVACVARPTSDLSIEV